MIARNELIKKISETIGKPKVLELGKMLATSGLSLHDLIGVTFTPDSAIAFRASWILENMLLLEPERYENELDYLLSRFRDVKYPGPQRHYVKIVMHLTRKDMPAAIKDKLKMLDLDPVIEHCFDLLINPKVKIAVKVFASETLFNLRHRFPWIAGELAAQLEFLMRDGSPAIQSRGRKLLTQLARDNK
ncbi:MAG TPA: hypothetical protein VHA56_12205 [Mucilaginibacter sp.]|nr:hypothetical protein [Mucilaginibacter sp.]